MAAANDQITSCKSNPTIIFATLIVIVLIPSAYTVMSPCRRTVTEHLTSCQGKLRNNLKILHEENRRRHSVAEREQDRRSKEREQSRQKGEKQRQDQERSSETNRRRNQEHSSNAKLQGNLRYRGSDGRGKPADVRRGRYRHQPASRLDSRISVGSQLNRNDYRHRRQRSMDGGHPNVHDETSRRNHRRWKASESDYSEDTSILFSADEFRNQELKSESYINGQGDLTKSSLTREKQSRQQPAYHQQYCKALVVFLECNDEVKAKLKNCDPGHAKQVDEYNVMTAKTQKCSWRDHHQVSDDSNELRKRNGSSPPTGSGASGQTLRDGLLSLIVVTGLLSLILVSATFY